MAGAVRLCVLSLSARAPDGDDAAYLAWHGLDHLPEQYGIEQVVHGQRWVSTPACRAARPAPGALDDADHAVQYLFTDPVEPGLERFFALGAELREVGRMPMRLPMVELGAYELAGWQAGPVAPEVLPWRPCRGVVLLVEEGAPSNVALGDGVAGWWRYRGGRFHDRLADTTGRHLTVVYVEGDPVAVGTRVASAAGEALLAAPFVAVTPFAWDQHLP